MAQANENMTVELSPEQIAEVEPHKLLPDDYEDNGIAGAGPTSDVGQVVHQTFRNTRRADQFIRGGPDSCPFDSKSAVEEHCDRSEDRYYKYLYGAENPRGAGKVYWCDWVPETCPFCHSTIDCVDGYICNDSIGRSCCPDCNRIFGCY